MQKKIFDEAFNKVFEMFSRLSFVRIYFEINIQQFSYMKIKIFCLFAIGSK